MSRKVIIDESMDFDETRARLTRNTTSELLMGVRRRRVQKAAETEKPAAAILPLYLREMGATPLIDETQEVSLARELQEARESIATIALKLPKQCRLHCLEGDLEGPKRGREWPLDDLEEFYGKVVRYEREYKDARVTTLVREAKRAKRRLNHARDALILANLRLVVHIAKKYLNYCHSAPIQASYLLTCLIWLS